MTYSMGGNAILCTHSPILVCIVMHAGFKNWCDVLDYAPGSLRALGWAHRAKCDSWVDTGGSIHSFGTRVASNQRVSRRNGKIASFPLVALLAARSRRSLCFFSVSPGVG
jgi:hypothetical protein